MAEPRIDPHSRVDPTPGHDQEQPITRTTVEARQGDRSKLNLRVLALSLILLATFFAALYFIFYGSQP